MKRFGPFGEGWPARLYVVVPGRRRPVASVLAHPLDRTALYWSTTVEAAPTQEDPRSWRPVIGRLDSDIRWARTSNLPARGLPGGVPRQAVLDALRQGQKTLIIEGPPTAR